METLLLISTITDILMTIMLERKDKLIHQVFGSAVAKPSQSLKFNFIIDFIHASLSSVVPSFDWRGKGGLLPSTIFCENVVATVTLYLYDYGCSGWRGDRCAAGISFESEAWTDWLVGADWLRCCYLDMFEMVKLRRKHVINHYYTGMTYCETLCHL